MGMTYVPLVKQTSEALKTSARKSHGSDQKPKKRKARRCVLPVQTYSIYRERGWDICRECVLSVRKTCETNVCHALAIKKREARV